MHPATETLPPIDADKQLSRMVTASGLAPDKQKGMLEALTPLAVKAAAILAESRSITVTDATQLKEMAKAGEHRKALMRFRTGVESVRKQAKADVLTQGRTIDDLCKWLQAQTEAEEDRLRSCEDFAKRAESARLARVKSEREAALREFTEPELYAFEDMTDEAFMRLLAKVKMDHAAEIARAAKAAEDTRLAEIQRKEQAERDRAERERLAEENRKLAAAHAESERVLALERELAEAEKREAEAATRKEREAEAKKLRESEAARMAAEQRERDRIAAEEAERRAAAHAAKKAAAAPDADKMMGYYSAIANIPKPVCKTDEGRAAMGLVLGRLEALLKTIKSESERLGT